SGSLAHHGFQEAAARDDGRHALRGWLGSIGALDREGAARGGGNSQYSFREYSHRSGRLALADGGDLRRASAPSIRGVEGIFDLGLRSGYGTRIGDPGGT